MNFSGFPKGTQYTPAPSPLFGPLLEEIKDLAELKCTLRAMWRIRESIRVHKGRRYVSEDELTTDMVLIKGVGSSDGGASPTAAIRAAMHQAAQRGTFIARTLDSDEQTRKVYFLNDEAGRKAALTLAPVPDDLAPLAAEEDETPEPKPNIFKLYEENIGLLTPLIGDQLKDAEDTYPWSWIEQAFTIAVNGNKRNWRYIEATLRRWASEGKDDGKPGRHSEKTSGQQEYLEYLRERGQLPRTL